MSQSLQWLVRYEDIMNDVFVWEGVWNGCVRFRLSDDVGRLVGVWQELGQRWVHTCSHSSFVHSWPICTFCPPYLLVNKRALSLLHAPLLPSHPALHNWTAQIVHSPQTQLIVKHHPHCQRRQRQSQLILSHSCHVPNIVSRAWKTASFWL